MTNSNDSWPDPERAGEPAEPTKTGPHALIDKYGRKVWAWWIYNSSTPGAWLVADNDSFHGGANSLASEGFKYYGQAVMPNQEINDK